MNHVANEGTLGITSVESSHASFDVQEIVQGINQRFATAEEGSMETGEFVLDAVFQGRLNEVTSRNPFKNNSLKEVCEDPKIRVDRRVLGTCVKAAHLKRSLLAADVDCSNLYYSHFVALLKVTDAVNCRELAVKANEEAWSVRQLTKEVNATKPTTNGGHKVKELLKKMDAALVSLGEADIKKLLEDQAEMEQALGTEDRLLIVKAIDQVIAKVNASILLFKQAKKEYRHNRTWRYSNGSIIFPNYL